MELSKLDRLDLLAQGIVDKVDEGLFMPDFDVDWLTELTPKFTWTWGHLLLLQEHLQMVASGELKKLMIWMPPRHGKQIEDNTNILTIDGWKNHGELDVGDYVYHPSGKAVKVLAVSGKTLSNVKVSFSNGEEVICHENHEWTVYNRSKSKWITVETKHWLDKTKYGKRRQVVSGGRCSYQVGTNQPLVNIEKNVLVEPYFLGAWLGDGKSDSPVLCGVKDDLCFIDRGFSYLCKNVNVHKTTLVHYNSYTHQNVLSMLRKIDVYNNKHIPDIYKLSSIEQRKQLIAGLIDTDGSVDENGRVRIVNINKRLIDDIFDILTTLGQRPYIMQQLPVLSTSGIQGKHTAYTVGFQPTISFPTRIPRKKIDRLVKQRRIGIVKVERIDEGKQGNCIQVDSDDGLYLVGKSLIPTHNSELTTIRFPVWWLERNPEQRVIVGAHSQTLANKFSRKIRKMASERIPIDKERRAVDEWETEAGGGVRAVGIGGGITGMGGNLIIVDDPVKSRKEANSITYRNAAYDWYTDDLYTRREPNGAMIIIQTRWHEDDLCGRILSLEDDWKVLNLPAIANSPDDALGRKMGEALCPERFNVEQLMDIKRVMGRGFESLYQQSPVEQEGDFFKRSWFTIDNDLPRHPEDKSKLLNPMKFMRFWDKASTISGDYTAGVLVAQDKVTKVFYIVDVVRDKLTTHKRDLLMLKTAYSDRETYGSVKIRHEQEPGSSGIDSAKTTNSLLAGFSVKAIRATGSKSLRAEPFQAQCEGKNVVLIKAHWNSDYLDELCSFPQGKHDDMVDGSSGSFNELVRSKAVIFSGSG